jgi:hypothetical protein
MSTLNFRNIDMENEENDCIFDDTPGQIFDLSISPSKRKDQSELRNYSDHKNTY